MLAWTARPRSALPGLIRRLLAARALRAVGQGVLTADFALYLHVLGWSPGVIGALLTTVLVVAVTLTALVGPLSDRMGRRRFILGYDLLVMAGALVLSATSNPWVLATVAVVAGMGRGGASNTPFTPVENAWLADAVPRRRRGQVYSLVTALGLGGAAVGAGIGVLPRLLQTGAVDASAYQPLFLIVAASALTSFLTLRGAAEPRRLRGARPKPALRRRQSERHRLGRLAAVNVLNGLGAGLTGPLMAYWFTLRFGLGPAAIAPVIAAGFLAAAALSLLTGRLTMRFGIMRAVVGMRLIALALLVVLPLLPSFWLAAVVHVARTACNLGTAGARQGLNLSLVSGGRRGAAGSLSTVAMQAPRAAGPFLAGVMFSAGTLTLPFILAAALQGSYLFFYQRSFRAHDPARPAW